MTSTFVCRTSENCKVTRPAGREQYLSIFDQCLHPKSNTVSTEPLSSTHSKTKYLTIHLLENPILSDLHLKINGNMINSVHQTQVHPLMNALNYIMAGKSLRVHKQTLHNADAVIWNIFPINPQNIWTLNLKLFVCLVALRPKSTAMVMAGRSVHLTTLFPWQAWTSS